MWRIRIYKELRELYKDIDIAGDIIKKIGMDWTCNKNGSRKDNQESICE
jgi:hypothetical protein